MSRTTDPSQFREILSYYLAGLEDGAVKPAQVVDWADRIIANDDVIDPFFADLSLAGQNINELLHIISEYLGAQHQPVGYWVALGDLYWKIERSSITPGETRERINRILYASSRTNDEERYRLIGSADALDLAIDRIYGSVDEAMNRLKEDLSIYAGFQVERPEQWHTAGLSVVAALQTERSVREERSALAEEAKKVAPPKKPWWKF